MSYNVHNIIYYEIFITNLGKQNNLLTFKQIFRMDRTKRIVLKFCLNASRTNFSVERQASVCPSAGSVTEKSEQNFFQQKKFVLLLL
jgi:hypothetical protein